MAEFGEPLSDRERDVLEKLMQGAANKEIAVALDISPNTVKVHLRNIYTKLGVSSRTEATMAALEQGIFTQADIFNDLSTPSETEAELSAPPLLNTKEAIGITEGELRLSQDDQSQGPITNPQPVVATLQPAWGRLILLGIGLVGFVLILLGILFYFRPFENAIEEASPALIEPSASVPPKEIEPNWFEAAAMPAPRTEMAAISVGFNVYQIGGRVEGGIVNAVHILDTSNGTWRTAADKPTAVAQVSAAEVLEIYVPGGLTADGLPTDTVEAYSPATDSWRVVQSLPKPLSGALALSSESAVYLFGGWDGTNYVADSYVYDPAADAWSKLPDMQHARAGAAGGVLSGRLYVVGGVNGEDSLDVCEFYDIQIGVWESCLPMSEPRVYADAAVVLNKLYVLGGQNSDNIYGELYNPSEEIWQIINVPERSADNAIGWQNPSVTNVEARIFIQGGTKIGESAASDAILIYAPPVYRTFIPAASGGS